MKTRAKYLTDEQISAEVAQMAQEIKQGKISEDEVLRDAYCTDPANVAEMEEQQARMDLVCAMYKARHAAGLTQKELADRMGTRQTYIAALEKGRKNITIHTLSRYARACGKKIALL